MRAMAFMHSFINLVLPPHRTLHLERLLLLRGILQPRSVELTVPAAASSTVAALQRAHGRREVDTLDRHDGVRHHRSRPPVAAHAVDVEHVTGVELTQQHDHQSVKTLRQTRRDSGVCMADTRGHARTLWNARSADALCVSPRPTARQSLG